MAVEIPADVQAMLRDKNFWHLATVGPNGAPQTTPVWADTDGTHVIVNTAKGRAKDRNMRAEPRVALSAFDPSNPYGFVEIQGRIAAIVDGQPAEDGIDDLAEKYLGERPYPFRGPGEQRVIFKVEPTAVTTWQRD
ncbi:MAG: PPOX class F420-dependent oxidoreductase [Gaiellales bacterium]